MSNSLYHTPDSFQEVFASASIRKLARDCWFLHHLARYSHPREESFSLTWGVHRAPSWTLGKSDVREILPKNLARLEPTCSWGV